MGCCWPRMVAAFAPHLAPPEKPPCLVWDPLISCRSEAGLGPGSSRPPPAQPAPGHRRKKARPHRAAWDAAGEDVEWNPRAEREGGRARRGLRPLRRAAAPAPGVEPYADFYSGHEYDSAGGGSPRSSDSEPSREAGSVLATAPLAAHAPGGPTTGPPGRNVVRLRLPARRGRSPGEAGAGKGPDAMALPRPAPAPGDVPRIESLAMLAGLVADASGPDPEGWAGKDDARGSAAGLLATTLALIVAGAAAALTPALARAGPPSAGPPSTEAARTGVRALRFTDQVWRRGWWEASGEGGWVEAAHPCLIELWCGVRTVPKRRGAPTRHRREHWGRRASKRSSCCVWGRVARVEEAGSPNCCGCWSAPKT